MKSAFLKSYVCAGLLVLFFAVSITGAFAQESASDQKKAQSRFFEATVRAADADTLVAGKTQIDLWGVHNIEGMGASFVVRARSALDNVIGGQKVRCEMKKRETGLITAQCANAQDLDLGLYMLQKGYAIVDRSVIYGSVFETAYIQAETDAQRQGLGVWAHGEDGSSKASNDGNLMLILGFVLFLCILAAFSLLALTIMRGFRKVVDAQNQNMDMMSRERELREKERSIYATMLDSEIKGNKSKIEAYLVVYDELLKSLEDPERTPKYKKSGDILQVQPALDRAVFDRNTDKLDVLGDALSSEVIHFYARIKTKPDYVNLEPDMPLEEAVEIVDNSIQNAKRMNKLADRLIDLFEQNGYASDDY